MTQRSMTFPPERTRSIKTATQSATEKGARREQSSREQAPRLFARTSRSDTKSPAPPTPSPPRTWTRSPRPSKIPHRNRHKRGGGEHGLMRRLFLTSVCAICALTTLGCANDAQVRLDRQTSSTPVCLSSGNPQAPSSLPGGFGAFVYRAPGKALREVDWTRGIMRVEGKGRPGQRGVQGELGSWRAAAVVAARNAIEFAAALRAEGRKPLGAFRNGRKRVQGVVRGHREVSSHWDDATQTQHVVIEVPLWGVHGIAEVFANDAQAAARRASRNRLTLSTQPAGQRNYAVVLDARGTGFSPCLFPRIADDRGRTLYDIAAQPVDHAGRQPVARYATSKQTLKSLRTERRESNRLFKLTVFQASISESAQARTDPNQLSQPHRARKRQRPTGFTAAPVIRMLDDAQSTLQITAKDAEALRKSADASNALLAGNLIILVDPQVTGVGAHLPAIEEILLAGAFEQRQTPSTGLPTFTVRGHSTAISSDRSSTSETASSFLFPLLQSLISMPKMSWMYLPSSNVAPRRRLPAS